MSAPKAILLIVVAVIAVKVGTIFGIAVGVLCALLSARLFGPGPTPFVLGFLYAIIFMILTPIVLVYVVNKLVLSQPRNRKDKGGEVWFGRPGW